MRAGEEARVGIAKTVGPAGLLGAVMVPFTASPQPRRADQPAAALALSRQAGLMHLGITALSEGLMGPSVRPQ